MNIETIVIVLIVIALIWTNLYLNGRIVMLEYRMLLATEALAEMEGSVESKAVARQARAEINTRFSLLDKIVQS